MDCLSFSQHLSDYTKSLVLNKNINEQYCEVVYLFLDVMLEYFEGQEGKMERVKSFSKAGGVKRLKSLPKFLLEKESITKSINRIIKLSNHS